MATPTQPQKPGPTTTGAKPGVQGSSQRVATPGPGGTMILRLKKGDLLFREGDISKAMYIVRNGMVRIFKKKGNSEIELDTIRSGQVLGELAFLDGNPRSASGEALTECEFMEISGDTFTKTLGVLPEWLKLLMKTIVGRLRSASTRIRQLEATSGDAASFTFLSAQDILKTCTAVLLAAIKYGSVDADGTKVFQEWVNVFTFQIMGVPIAKIASVLDGLTQMDTLIVRDSKEGAIITVLNLPFIEEFIQYQNTENQLEPSRRHTLTIKGFLIMSLIAKHIANYPVDPGSGASIVNLMEIISQETAAMGKEAFRPEEFPELTKLGYASPMLSKSSDVLITLIKAEDFQKAYRLQRLMKIFEAMNEEKRNANR